jgi:flavin reductase (DIM6/NTAB) family NADH-FMN oxidoreductase RutF
MNPRTEHPSVQAGFREAMAMVCTPVAVVTAQRSGVPFGTTVSAFTSLSMDPPMLLVSLDRGSGLLAVIRDVGQFGVNVLSNQQADLATNFAVNGARRSSTESRGTSPLTYRNCPVQWRLSPAARLKWSRGVTMS